MNSQNRREYSVQEVASVLNGEVQGDASVRLSGIQPLEDAKEYHLSFLHRKRYAAAAVKSRAGAIIVGQDHNLAGRTVIVVSDPRRAYREAIELFFQKQTVPPRIAEGAHIDASVTCGAEVHIGVGAIVAENVVLEDGVAIMAGAIVGSGCRIGAHSVIHSGAVIYPGVQIGKRVVIHACAVIGSDGFGFQRAPSGELLRIRQLGSVTIEDDVEIGPCACVQGATLTETRIGRGSKLDAHVLIGHNVKIGRDTLVIGQTGIAGSSRVGSGSSLYGQVGVRGHVALGDGTVVLAKSAVWKDTVPGSTVAGNPAVPVLRWRRIVASLLRLPEALRALSSVIREGRKRNERGGCEE